MDILRRPTPAARHRCRNENRRRARRAQRLPAAKAQQPLVVHGHEHVYLLLANPLATAAAERRLRDWERISNHDDGPLDSLFKASKMPRLQPRFLVQHRAKRRPLYADRIQTPRSLQRRLIRLVSSLRYCAIKAKDRPRKARQSPRYDDEFRQVDFVVVGIDKAKCFTSLRSNPATPSPCFISSWLLFLPFPPRLGLPHVR